MREVVIGRVETPVGRFGAVITPEGIGRLAYPDENDEGMQQWARRWEPGAQISADGPVLQELGQQLSAYFAGELEDFDLPLDLRGTPFQVEVWKALLDIRYGEISTYGRLAARLGRPEASRAVGAANGANPIPIIVPCHRVIGTNGRLTGYGGGLDLKRRLLELEGVMVALSGR